MLALNGDLFARPVTKSVSFFDTESRLSATETRLLRGRDKVRQLLWHRMETCCEAPGSTIQTFHCYVPLYPNHLFFVEIDLDTDFFSIRAQNFPLCADVPEALVGSFENACYHLPSVRHLCTIFHVGKPQVVRQRSRELSLFSTRKRRPSLRNTRRTRRTRMLPI